MVMDDIDKKVIDNCKEHIRTNLENRDEFFKAMSAVEPPLLVKEDIQSLNGEDLKNNFYIVVDQIKGYSTMEELYELLSKSGNEKVIPKLREKREIYQRKANAPSLVSIITNNCLTWTFLPGLLYIIAVSYSEFDDISSPDEWGKFGIRLVVAFKGYLASLYFSHMLKWFHNKIKSKLLKTPGSNLPTRKPETLDQVCTNSATN